jgi:hypothetical protein
MIIRKLASRLWSAATIFVIASVGGAAADAVETATAHDAGLLISQPHIGDLRAILGNPLVHRSIAAQNARYGTLSQADIDTLDAQWRGEREADDKPLIAMTLSNPLSSYLTRVQANAVGLYAAIFVMDRNGLNVGQSAITGDFWQGDEAKFERTFPVDAGAVFIDEPEWMDDLGVWIAQANLSIADPVTGEAIGAATFDVNLTELARRAAAAN